MKTYCAVYFGSALVATFGMPIVTRLAKRFGLVDPPGVRKIHSAPVPRVGGVILVVAMLALTIPVFALDNTIGEAFRKNQTQMAVLLVASVFVFLVGLIDDLRGVRALVKLAVLVGAALAVCLSGARIDSVTMGSLLSLELGWLSWPATILWIVTVTVGLNFIDGLDGLAAGISLIVCGVITLMAFYTGQIVMAVLMLGMLGSLTGFLFFNFNPAKVFMGDGGSFFLGFVISAGSVVCVAKASTLVGIAVPALALGVPLLDTAFTVIRRGILDRRSIFAAERGHIHHRLLDMGLNQRRAVAVLYGATLLAAGLGAAMLVIRDLGTVVLLVIVLALLFCLFQLVGAARLKETFTAIKRNSVIARLAKEERQWFEDAQLHLHEAKSFNGLWNAACSIADKMGFERLALSQSMDATTNRTLVWRRSSQGATPREIITISVPLRNGSPEASVWIEAGLRADDSLETAGRRVMLFGRLVDEWMEANLFDMAGDPAAAQFGTAPEGPGFARGSPPRSEVPDQRADLRPRPSAGGEAG